MICSRRNERARLGLGLGSGLLVGLAVACVLSLGACDRKQTYGVGVGRVDAAIGAAETDVAELGREHLQRPKSERKLISGVGGVDIERGGIEILLARTERAAEVEAGVVGEGRRTGQQGAGQKP